MFKVSQASQRESLGQHNDGQDSATVEIKLLPRLLSQLKPEACAALLDQAGMMVCYIDAQLRYSYVNKAYASYVGLEQSVLVGQSIKGVIGERNFKAAMLYLKRVFSGETVEFSQSLTHPNGETSDFDVYMSPTYETAQITGFFCIRTRKEAGSNRNYNGSVYRHLNDALTGLRNRCGLYEDIGAINLRNTLDQGYYLVQFNLQRFGDVNKTHGHLVGDQVIRQFAQRLKQLAEKPERVYRLGGDEFAMLFARSPIRPSLIEKRVKHIINALNLPFVINGQTLRVDSAVGVATSDQNEGAHTNIVNHADIATSNAQEQGLGFVYYNTGLSSSYLETASLLRNLRLAIANKDIIPWLQPLVDVKTRRVLGYEALARWVQPDGTVIPPDRFIPVAEQSGLITDLGDQILEQAIHYLMTFKTVKGRQPYVSVNVSPVQLLSSGYIERLEAILVSQGFDRSRLLLEVTEEIAAEDNQRLFQVVSELKSHGFKIACDDFGAGYSSLSRLRDMPWDYIKIDRSFLADDKETKLLEPVTQMVKSLNLPVIVEGVETQADHEKIMKLGCDHAQGYLYGKPEPVL